MPFVKEKIELGFQEAELNAQSYWLGLTPGYKILLLVVILGIIPAYILTKSLSYEFWESQYASAISSAQPSFTAAKPVRVIKQYLFNSGDGSYSYLAQVANDNLDISLEAAPFSVDFYDASGQKVQTVSDKFFLLPGQTKFIVLPRVISSVDLSRGQISFGSSLPWQKRLSIPTAPVAAAVPVISQSGGGEALLGSITNNSPYQLGQVHIIFLLYDAAGNVIGASSRDEFTLSPSEQRTYTHLWPAAGQLAVAKIVAVAETDTLDPNNLGVVDSGNSASDLGRPQQQQ